VSDVRLRLSHTIHNTEGGKRVHSVVSNTTRVVADTGKVVAGGIGAAKVSFTLSILCRFTGRGLEVKILFLKHVFNWYLETNQSFLSTNFSLYSNVDYQPRKTSSYLKF
jgi:hypothetical protein